MIQSAGSGEAAILVAEDHEDSRDALRALLEAVGYRVHLAHNGREAVERALALKPDLVVMDIMMPEMDGFEVTRRLRRNGPTESVPIIAVTAMHGATELALEAGVDEVVAKPINIRALLSTVRTWLGPELDS